MKSLKKYVSFELDKTRNLRYGMQALSIVEEKFDCSIQAIDYDNLRIKDLAIIIHAGLVHEDKELTVEKVMELIDEYSDITTATKKMAVAMMVSNGVDENTAQKMVENELEKKTNEISLG